ncbi:Immunoglobulin superfamily member 10 [Oryzias melastigma]|nr:Immunoglobulin superfamily member 10 [Oryzias melastigma]
MTLDCSADGNPKPETHWNYTSAENLHVATVGRHKIMTITRATSTNAGKYVCVASNKLGMETRFVLLTEIGKSSEGQISGFLWCIILPIIFIVILFIVTALLYYKKKKYGSYNVVGSKDPKQIPMTSISAAANS